MSVNSKTVTYRKWKSVNVYVKLYGKRHKICAFNKFLNLLVQINLRKTKRTLFEGFT